MGAANASNPTTLAFDCGVLNVHLQVALATLRSNDAAVPGPLVPPLLTRGGFHVNGNVADDEIVVTAELLVCVVTVTTVAVDGMRQ